MSSERYCLRTDNDGHEYCIPVDRIDDFDKWLITCGEFEEPQYANIVEGGFTFSDPEYY